MRIALISIAAPEHHGGSPASESKRFQGRTIASHQLRIALDMGCEQVLCLDGSDDTVLSDLRKQAEAAGAAFDTMKSPLDLCDRVTVKDEIFAIISELLPDRRLISKLPDTPFVTALPADLAVPLGYERIDAARAWAGVLRAPGSIAAQLPLLPNDIDLMSTLLRLTLQSGAPLVDMDPECLEYGTWQFAPGGTELAEREARWFADRRPEPELRAPGIALGEKGGHRLARDVMGTRYEGAPLAASAVMIATGLLAAALNWPVIALVLAGLAFIAARMAMAIDRLSADGGMGKGRGKHLSMLELAIDVLLGFALFKSGEPEFEWLRVFVPVMLLGVLYLARSTFADTWGALMKDRATLCFGLGALQVFDLAFVGAAIMAAVILILSLIRRERELMAN